MDAVLDTEHDVTVAPRPTRKPQPTVAAAASRVPAATSAPVASPFPIPPGYFGETSAVLLGMMLARSVRR